MGFKILHTSDWHLGARLMSKEREEEQKIFLDFLIEIVQKNRIDLLIVAGDIFDNGMPSNSARKLYYSFLTRLLHTCCKHVVIIGGNHDSPAMLEAPKEVLSILNVHVVGSVMSDEEGQIVYENEIIEIKNDTGTLQAVIAAVPYLRDRDIMKAVAGQEYSDRIEAMRNGMKEHYSMMAQKMKNYSDVPCIATGHLFAQNTILSDNAARQEGENDIHIGNLVQIDMSAFYQQFSYLALGHIHKPQILGGKPNVRYSGSPIKMSFSEINDRKIVLLVEFDGFQMESATEIEIPAFRTIQRFKGDLEKVTEIVENFENKQTLNAWGEIIFTDYPASSEIDLIKELALEKDLEILKYSIQVKKRVDGEDDSNENEAKSLSELSEMDIFKMRCKAENLDESEIEELVNSFNELRSWILEVDLK
ncbi:MAG: exonuclease SbcCD subunit D C-terminal domain-containing protein [Bacteroidales bacterium]|nr:exonuclease SbcCD subunit D C-terminal domain-containing protein [Bacteroidales bacterium]